MASDLAPGAPTATPAKPAPVAAHPHRDLSQFWYDDPSAVASAKAAGIAQGPARPAAGRGKRTRQRLVEQAEAIFADVGYQEASIVRITEAADVAQGTFYRYFDSKQQIFEEVVVDLNYRVRRAMTVASADAPTRLDAERRGFAAFFQFTADHPALYRVIRQAEFVSPRALRYHYERIIGSYIPRLETAMADGEVGAMDSTVLAWALIAVGELTGMRWILWDEAQAMPPAIFEQLITVIGRMLGVGSEPGEAPGSLQEATAADGLQAAQRSATGGETPTRWVTIKPYG